MKTDSKRQKFVFKRTLAEARSLAFLALAPSALVLADARSLAFLALAPLALVLADARSLAFLASAPYPLVFWTVEFLS